MAKGSGSGKSGGGGKKTIYRRSDNGQITTKKYAEKHPNTAEKERVERRVHVVSLRAKRSNLSLGATSLVWLRGPVPVAEIASSLTLLAMTGRG